MIATTKFDVELALPKMIPEIYVVQDDRYSRAMQMNLLMHGVPFELPEGFSAVMTYVKPDGRKGAYDTLPDGNRAWEIQGSRVWIALAPEVCAAAGDVKFMVSLIRNESKLGTFEICIHVKALAKGMPHSKDYLNITGFLPQPASGNCGEFLKVSWIDDFGRVAGVETVEMDVLPKPTEDIEGAFLRVEDGVWTAVQLQNAEEVEF